MSSYDYDPDAAGHADDVANRIDESAAYVGQFKRAEAVVSQQKGTEGMLLEFELPNGGSTEFTLWTRKADGTPIFGMNQLQAILTIFNLKGLSSVPGTVQEYDADLGKRVEVDGEVFPDLLKKPIGVILQKEKYTSNSGRDSYRMNLFGIFHPESRLTASEIKERKVKPEKFEKMLRGLKDKDSRKKKEAEPSQPAMGADGGY